MKYFHIFPYSKIEGKLSKICTIGNLEAHFQQVPLVQFFWNYHTDCCETAIPISNSAKKSKQYFLRQNTKNKKQKRNTLP